MRKRKKERMGGCGGGEKVVSKTKSQRGKDLTLVKTPQMTES